MVLRNEAMIFSFALILKASLGFCSFYPLNFITISTGDNPIFGHTTSEPGFLAAYNRLKPLYPEIFMNSTWHSFYYPGGNIPCADAAIQMEFIAGDIYDQMKNVSGFTILLSTGCSLETMVLGDFAREWDAPLFSSTSGDTRLANKLRFPTVLSGSGAADHTSMAFAAKALLDKYRWRTLTFLYDLGSQYPGVNAFFTLSHTNIKAMLQLNLGEYSIQTFRFDSGGPDFDADALLQKTKRQSRGTEQKWPFIFLRQIAHRENSGSKIMELIIDTSLS
ncbi:hypothetical protein RvY_16546 [Ramazzottius varieornatus]|uniref:Receptor ligand binding region domain-containing protein n=1 Tax=Ramazzottius varieornatus TaxID=947166 RepID=A0A1D1VYU9_RAMVA|nr:hypothetical protein RvY_16546 [Ramazzottius varieornatus]